MSQHECRMLDFFWYLHVEAFDFGICWGTSEPLILILKTAEQPKAKQNIIKGRDMA